MIDLISKLKKRYNHLSITAKATIWFMICSTLQRVILILTTPLFTRLMSTEQYGQYTVYTSWLQVFTIMTTLRLNAGGFNKAMSKFSDKRDEFVATNQTLTSILTLFFFIIYLIFINQINSLTELGTLVTLSMFVELLFTPAISFWTIRQRYEYKYRSVVFITVLIALMNAGLGLVAVLMTPVEKGTARIMSCVIVQVVIGLVLYIRNYIKSKKIFNLEHAKYAMGFCLPLLPHYLSVYVLDQSDRIMIQKLCGESDAGIYGVAYSACMVMKIVTESITNALVPWMYSRLEVEETKDIKKKIMPLMYIVILAISIFIAFAPEVIIILAGENYSQAIYVIPPVTASIFFLFIYTIFANVEFFFEAKKFTMFVSVVGAVLNIILNFIFIKLFGFVAAGYTTLVCYMIFAYGHYLYMCIIFKNNKIKNIFTFFDLLIPSVVIVTICILMSVLYSFFVIRYIVILLIVIICLIFKDKIINIIANIKKK